MKDANGDRIERHDATAEDIARLYGLADAFVLVVTPGDDVAIESYDHTATDLQVRYFGRQDIIDVTAFAVADFATMMPGATEPVDAGGTDVFLDLGGGDIIKIGDVTRAQLSEAAFPL